MLKESKSSENPPKKFYIKTFGCQMNKNDSSIITDLLEQGHFQRVDDLHNADIYVVNTCSVREHAEQRALGHISALKKWRDKPGKSIIVTGCMARRLSDEITRRFAFVDLILGPDSYRNIAGLIDELYRKKTRIIDTQLSDELYSDIFPRRTGISDFISIMRGCNNFCSYCVVPYVRGSVRSRPVNDIVAEVNQLIAQGVKDITLLGQNVNEYLYDSITFAQLLEHIAQQPDLCRLRFLTSHPKDLSADIITAVQRHAAICEWFHLPLQSGSDRILHLMNRRYTRDDYLQLIEQIRTAIPEATITTDVIAGFPTETASEFEDTLELMKEIRFDDAYLYRYSHRSRTRAAELEPLPERIIMDRLHQLIELQNNIVTIKSDEMIGKHYEVLFESRARYGGTRGKTRGNKDIIVQKDIIAGRLGNVVIRDVQGRTPIGDILESGSA